MDAQTCVGSPNQQFQSMNQAQRIRLELVESVTPPSEYGSIVHRDFLVNKRQVRD